MQNVADQATELFMHLALASGKVTFATLHRASEVAARAKQHAAGLAKDQWWLRTYVPEGMFRCAEKETLRHLGKLVRGNAGTLYAVLAQQAGPWQHRFVLQLVGDQMRQYLQEASRHGFVLSLGHEEESLIVPDCRYLANLVSETCVVAQSAEDLRAIGREACQVAVAMMACEAVAEPTLMPVRDVCVSIVVSAEVLDRTARLDKAGLGQRD